MSIQLRKNLLIICEGTLSEPNYLYDIRDKLIKKSIKYTIDIRPKPTKEQDEAEFTLRPGAKKRAIRNVGKEILDTIVEDEYKAQPLRYVREAQIGLEDQTFDEVWAVFDKDQHPKTKEAFELAEKVNQGKKVNLAFSNISFEVWILLHFELCKKSFSKTQCREGNEYFDCGTNQHEKDCHGVNCICGYIKSKNYLPYDRKVKETSFLELEDKTPLAIKNAYLLRQGAFSQNPETPTYDFNPFTSLDRLVFKLLNLPINYTWIDLKNAKIDRRWVIVDIDKTVLKISVKNDNQTFIFLPEFISLLNASGKSVNPLPRTILSANEEKNFELQLGDFKDLGPIYIAFKLSEGDYQISELPLF